VGATAAQIRGRREGERTVASVEADDEAGLLLDFLRHVGGGGVFDGERFVEGQTWSIVI
jgi:hypothetical protein